MQNRQCTCDGPGGCPVWGAAITESGFRGCQSGALLGAQPECCVYLGQEEPGKKTEDGRQVFKCQIHERCTIDANNNEFAACGSCKQRLTRSHPHFVHRYQDGLFVVDRDKRPTDVLHGVLAGSSAFLAGGGPSANDLPLEQLNKRGAFTLAVNNMGAHPRFRPQAFVCSDPPSKFHNNIWMDPAIMKFVPTPKLNKHRGRLRRKINGEFESVHQDNGRRLSACHAPNVWGFQRRSWMMPDDTFFLNNGAAWGNLEAGYKLTGETRVVCTLLLGLRLLYYLGARRIYLIGVDFQMSPAYGYAFAQARDADASKQNNNHFAAVNEWLCRMQVGGVFERFGLSVYNCFEHSGLRAFPYTPFADAMVDAQSEIDDPPDLSGWYEKGGKK